MTTPLVCPDEASLHRLALGQLDPDEITTLQEHLADCPSCVAAVDRLSADDPLVRAVRGSARRAGAEDEAVDRLMERLRAIDPCGPDSTVTFARAAGDTPVDDTVEVCDFLVGPAEPGELGRLGKYRVRRVLGSGGMGIVFEAEDPKLQRPVALKVMRPNLAGRPEAGDRFLQEARATAAIQHDHIVTIHEVGEDQGVPYLAMQLLHGETLESRLRRLGRRPAAEVVRLGRQIARGLAAAHDRGLIHRDVKPANIWIETVAGTGAADRVKLLDFGLARAAAESAQTSQPGLLAGTPAYMAPEQAADGPIDHRCDLFGLGCVFYRMCTGELPFKGEKPLTVLWALAVQDPVPPRQLNPEVPAALSDLIMRLLAKDPADRPQSAREVSEALGAIDLSEPRTAPRPARRPRRRAVAALAVALLVLLAVGGALYGPTLYRLVSNRGQVVIVIDADDPDVKVLIKDKEQSAILDPKADREVTLKAGDYQVELLEAQLGQRLSARELTLKRGDRQVVSVEWAPPGLVHTLVGHTDDIHAVRWCLDGTYVLSASGGRFEFGKWVRGSDFALRLWDAKTGREVGSLPDHTDKVLALAVSPDGKRAVSAGGDAGRDYQLRYWDLETRKLIRRFDQRHTERINDLAFAPDGKRVVSAGSDKTVRLWDVETGRVIATFQEGETQPVWSVDISRDGKRIITGNWDGLLRLWDIDTQKQTRKPVPTGHTNLHVIRFAPDGRHALTQAGKGKVMLVDLETGRTVRSFQCDAQSMGGVFSPDGRRILTVGQDPFIRLWDVATGQELWKSAGHTGDVLSVAFSPDGQFAASAGSDKTVRIWRLGDSASPGQGVKMFGD